ncbi:MAG: DUF2085 domain-containing protein [Anaerolineae bacterium]|nr:DUF2085 domain-containing protein [Anaerolineae bacterium]
MEKPVFPRYIKWLGIVLAVGGLVMFLLLTPGNVLRKFDYVGAAVCHRRASHSFTMAERQLPLCQRCSGTFPGALMGIIVHWGIWRRRRSIGYPAWPMLVIFGVCAAFWGLDGINSTTSDGQFAALLSRFINLPEGVGILGYAPQPWLRLVSGVLMGMSMSAILVPAFNQTMWTDAEDKRALRSWHELGLLAAFELALAAFVFLIEPRPEPIFMVLVSILQVTGVLTMFVLLGAMLFTLLLRRDAQLLRWRDAWVPLLWGFLFALAVVSVMDILRLQLTGTIDGIPGSP